MVFFFSCALLLYGAVGVLIGVMQRKLIYFPSRAPEAVLSENAERNGLIPWRDSEQGLIGWRTRSSSHAPERHRRMLVFHGNGGHASSRNYLADGLSGAAHESSVWDVYLFEYPGYGARGGKPSEPAFISAAGAAIEALMRESSDPVYLTGESLGTGVAARIAVNHPASGVLLITPFTSLADVAALQYPYLPVRLLLRDGFEVESILNGYGGPVAFLVAGRDETTPSHLGRRLYEMYQGPKQMWIQDDAMHNTVDFSPNNPWWREVSDFLSASAVKNSAP